VTPGAATDADATLATGVGHTLRVEISRGTLLGRCDASVRRDAPELASSDSAARLLDLRASGLASVTRRRLRAATMAAPMPAATTTNAPAMDTPAVTPAREIADAVKLEEDALIQGTFAPAHSRTFGQAHSRTLLGNDGQKPCGLLRRQRQKDAPAAAP